MRKPRVTKRTAGEHMAVIGYPRVSTEEQARDGKSLELQVEKIRAYCALYNLRLVRIVPDAGVSAKSLDRPGIKQVIAALESGEVDGVVITKLDRLTRSLADWSVLIERFFDQRAGRALFSVNDSIDTRTASGRMVLNIIMTIAQWEREIIAERTAEVLQGKIRRGERCGRVRYGYALDESGPRHSETGRPIKLRPNEREQGVIAQMRAWRAQGLDYRAMCALLADLGIETQSGGRVWLPATVHRILTRPIP